MKTDLHPGVPLVPDDARSGRSARHEREGRRLPTWGRAAAAVAIRLALAPSAFACDPTLDAQTDAWSARAAGGSACPVITSGGPFARHSQNPIFDAPSSFCFAVARDDAGYVMLRTESDGFHIGWSRLGVNWPGGLNHVFPSDQSWFKALRCPDPAFDENGRLHLYFKAWPDAQDYSGRGGIAYAYSDDRGRTWTVHPTPALEWMPAPGERGGLHMPSVVDRGAGYVPRFVMAYVTKPVPGPRTAIYIAFSNDRTTWTRHVVAPVLSVRNVEPDDVPWDDELIGRPRLFVESPFDLHMIFVGQATGASGRKCVKLGHAVSNDGGMSWAYTGTDPVFDADADPLAWDGVGVVVPSFTHVPAQNVFRMYYGGVDATGDARLGFARSAWPPQLPRIGSFAPPEVVGASAPGAGSRSFVSAQPDPFAVSTTLVTELADVDRDQVVEISVFDVHGRRVRRLWSGAASAVPREIEWDGRGGGGSRLAPGRYIVEIRTSSGSMGARWLTKTN